MNSEQPDRERLKPILQGVSQFEVDFVIPRLGIDLPLGIDPFLLFKSRDPAFIELHALIIQLFNAGLDALRRNDARSARQILDFPEVAEIGLGYTKKGKRGAGVGTYLTELIIETLKDSPALMERGVHHIEELQLVAEGIGPDRISDIAGNILKRFLITYSQHQSELWSLPLASNVPVGHVFDPTTFAWQDGFFDLPVSPIDKTAIILVPRRIVRSLPWINYDDFFRLEFAAYLRSKRVRHKLQQRTDAATPDLLKSDVTALTRSNIDSIDRYIARKEASAAKAQPSSTYLDSSQACPEAEKLKDRLITIRPGREQAGAFQHAVLAILNYLFNPELIDGETEVATIEGTERRDIIFTNDSDQTFWTYVRVEHSAVFLMFETKNTDDLDPTAINQTATYLGNRLGRLGFIVTRSAPTDANLRKVFSVFNDSDPKKVVLILSDQDLIAMLDQKCKGLDPMRHIQKIYRHFRTSVQ